MSFKPALVIVDVQEDFCPPNGALAVTGGRNIVPIINEFLTYPFTLKVATKDFHPPDHVSFASNHSPPNNKPFESTFTIKNPNNPDETQETRLWPDHCVQGTKGSELLPELDVSKVDHIVEKGQDKRVEMYSAFADPFKRPSVAKSGLAETLRKAEITDVFVVGLAGDYCVKYTAIDAQKEGFKTWVVGDATRAVDPSAMGEVHKEYEKVGVTVIAKDDAQVQRVKEQVQRTQDQGAKDASKAGESVLD
ncbi:pyrazinamidase/nicotinamidase-like protein [Alternaria rosae]|uniref:pyrazinamidase/nicotinamidase-like protein n=1 Tax=Alternaria rosae TaxID=1187941 RepID=UPI001E8E9752|nr:pyrazinamidase/nicotinamidase-like protein [Alternaria rosae]KAH6883052.1 pyrazinamidase/nicotinamidase-like protein [Alternaria rosae]